jgi:hypothetical protein
MAEGLQRARFVNDEGRTMYPAWRLQATWLPLISHLQKGPQWHLPVPQGTGDTGWQWDIGYKQSMETVPQTLNETLLPYMYSLDP